MAGIYIHVPFCATRCIYCDFYSTTLRNKGPQYVEALVREMEERKDFLHEPVRTIYLGGGTPSQLGPECIRAILVELAKHFDLSQCEEITMEANPEDFVNGLWTFPDGQLLPGDPLPHSINRISMGVQSMVDSELRLLHRRHDAAHVREAVKRLREANIDNLSLDLMYGLPTQTLASWEYSINELLKLEPKHISAYNLSVEEGTRLSRLVEKGELTPCDDDTCLEMAALLRRKLKSAGFEQYEISNYAKPGYYSRHNSSYWVQTPYLGLGPGAHSYDGAKRRSWNVPDVESYLNGKREEGAESLSELDIYNEHVMLGLRTASGVSMRYFENTGIHDAAISSLKKTIESLQSRGLVHINENRLSLTEAGLALGDEVIRELMILD